MKIPCTLVFDIGKSNKKLFLFDKDFNVLFHENMKLEEIEDDDGFPSEDILSLEIWIKDKVQEIAHDKRFQLEVLNFSTYGASLVNLDKHGKIVTPFYNYLKPFPEKLKEHFFRKYYGEEGFSKATSSPSLGMLNAGLQLYFLKYEKPDLFKKIHKSLHFPQYLSSLFSGMYFSEYTSLGCHTGMWDFKKNVYASWLEKEALTDLLAPIVPARTIIPVEMFGNKIKLGIGVHDSSSNLIPYLSMKGSFALISTGTWSICLNPFSNEDITSADLKGDCLQFLSYMGRPVRASRLYLGAQFHKTVNQIGVYFNKDHKHYKSIYWDKNFKYKRRVRSEILFDHDLLEPERFGLSCQESNLSQFDDYQDAYLNFMDELTDLQIDSLNLAIGKNQIDKVIIDGGFSTNEVFVKMLAHKLPEKQIYTHSSSMGAALGAAMLMYEKGPDNLFKNGYPGLISQKPN